MPIMKQPPPPESDGDERARPRDFNGLVAELEAQNPAARRWAARDLVEANPDAGAEVSAVLLQRLEREDNPAVREAIFTGLTRLGDAVAVAGLVSCLRSEDATLRNEAIEALKQLPEAVAPMMHGLLQDADPDVRIFAVNVLESLRHPQVEAWLIAVIEQDPHVNVCATAVDLLGEVGSSAARSALEALRQRFVDEPYIRFAADLALKRINED